MQVKAQGTGETESLSRPHACVSDIDCRRSLEVWASIARGRLEKQMRIQVLSFIQNDGGRQTDKNTLWTPANCVIHACAVLAEGSMARSTLFNT